MENRIVWPPRVIQQTPLGILTDDSDSWLPRDIGRSSQFSNGHVVVQFGDTFAHDSNEMFTGLVDNTCAVVPYNNKPTRSKYILDKNYKVHGFVPHSEGDVGQIKYWSFSGIVETGRDGQGRIEGYTWVQISQVNKSDPAGTYLEMGVAKVVYDPTTRRIKVTRLTTDSRDYSNNKRPSFGYTCALKIDDYIYLYGQTNIQEKDIVLARVRISEAESFRDYEFFTGSGWSTDIDHCKPIMRRIEHGQIFPTTMFGKYSDFKYCFIGCSSDGDSKVRMSRAKLPQGPWDDGYVLDIHLYNSESTKRGWQPTAEFMYCMYPHPWAFGFNTKSGLNRTGELMITWSEGGMHGGVLAVCAGFQMETLPLTWPSPVAPNNDYCKWDNGPDSIVVRNSPKISQTQPQPPPQSRSRTPDMREQDLRRQSRTAYVSPTFRPVGWVKPTNATWGSPEPKMSRRQ